jgi:hypothetical protein
MFEEAQADGEDATQNIASILNGFLQNCFVAVFEDDRWGTAVKEQLEIWAETMTRRRVKSILVQLKKHNRIIYNLVPDYNCKKPDIDCVFEQAPSVSLDLLMVIDSEGDRTAPPGVEIATRLTYQNTTFEPKRSEIAVDGMTCGPGDMDESAFMDFHFAKALKFASTIHICDRMCGKTSFTGNFRYTVERLMGWLGSVLVDPSSCKIIFHLGQPPGHGQQFILQQLTSIKSRILNSTQVDVHFYDESLPKATLPHQRFIMTEQIALDVDRGLDFLDRTTQKCRDTYVNYQNLKEAQKLLSSYSSGCISTHTI